MNNYYPINIDDIHEDMEDEVFEFYDDEAVKQAQKDYIDLEMGECDEDDLEENIIIVNKGLKSINEYLDLPNKWDKFKL